MQDFEKSYDELKEKSISKIKEYKHLKNINYETRKEIFIKI
jgi:hypothetical protein